MYILSNLTLYPKATYDVSKHIGELRLSAFDVVQTDSVCSADRQSIQLPQVTAKLFTVFHSEPWQWLRHAGHAAGLQHAVTFSCNCTEQIFRGNHGNSKFHEFGYTLWSCEIMPQIANCRSFCQFCFSFSLYSNVVINIKEENMHNMLY